MFGELGRAYVPLWAGLLEEFDESVDVFVSGAVAGDAGSDGGSSVDGSR
jgi:hypothetical protein